MATRSLESKMSILSILNELAADNSRLTKIAILKREKNNKLLKEVILAALHPYINYFQKKIPDYVSGKCFPCITLNEALTEIDRLSSREITGNTAKNHLGWILQNCSEPDAQVIECIIGRDLKCGVDTSTANKVWPGLVPTFDVMLAHKDTSGISYPAIAQTKMDGARCHLFYDGKVVTAYSRAGKEFQLHGALDATAAKVMYRGVTLDGELLFIAENGKFLDRKTSNGLANKANKGTITPAEAARVVFVAWDIVDFEGTIPYKMRFDKLKASIEFLPKHTNIRLVKSKIVKNEEQAMDFYDEQIAAGEEGAVIKNLNGVWVPKRSKDLGKIKVVEEADLIIVGWEEGTGKNVGKLGALVGETSDGLLCVGVGTGFSDNERASITKDVIGGIMTVYYNAIIESKGKNQKSLFLPRFSEIRYDKKKANSLGELK